MALASVPVTVPLVLPTRPEGDVAMEWAMAMDVDSEPDSDEDSVSVVVGGVDLAGTRGADLTGAHLRILRPDLRGLLRRLGGGTPGALLRSAEKRNLST